MMDSVYIFPDGRMKPKDAAEYLGIAEGTLANKRTQGGGPPFVKILTKIFYYKNDLDLWLDEHRSCVTTAQSRLTSMNRNDKP